MWDLKTMQYVNAQKVEEARRLREDREVVLKRVKKLKKKLYQLYFMAEDREVRRELDHAEQHLKVVINRIKEGTR